MSGRGHSGQQPDGSPLGGSLGDKIGEKIKAEWLSALRLLFKSAELHAVNLKFPCTLTVFATGISCEDEPVDVQPPTPAFSDNVIAALQAQETIQKLTLQKQVSLLASVSLAESAPCAWNPVLCSEPVFEAMQFNARPVALHDLMQRDPLAWPIQPVAVAVKSKSAGPLDRPRLNEGSKFKILSAQSRKLKNCALEVFTQKTDRFYALPIRKVAIPPHRFSPAMREQFRALLAEKAATSANNVQLKMIYERLNMGLYEQIQVDESGNLMATPKNLTPHTPNAHDSGASYLVVGLRLDTKVDIRALIPVESLVEPIEPQTEGGTRA
jgi:hypothetical protein